VRRQSPPSRAATALSMRTRARCNERAKGLPDPSQRHDRGWLTFRRRPLAKSQSGVALRLPPHSKGRPRIRSGYGRSLFCLIGLHTDVRCFRTRMVTPGRCQIKQVSCSGLHGPGRLASPDHLTAQQCGVDPARRGYVTSVRLRTLPHSPIPALNQAAMSGSAGWASVILKRSRTPRSRYAPLVQSYAFG